MRLYTFDSLERFQFRVFNKNQSILTPVSVELGFSCFVQFFVKKKRKIINKSAQKPKSANRRKKVK